METINLHKLKMFIMVLTNHFLPQKLRIMNMGENDEL